jgi:3-phenylpropionate/trans-cinnamate dioxygenase ferredoxin reductase subunit
MRSITVVGASPAGLSTVRTLRTEGFEGEIVVVGEERHTPCTGGRPFRLRVECIAGALSADAYAAYTQGDRR